MELSLHQLTATDASPGELVEIARELGVQGVCLFTQIPDAAAGRFPVVVAGEVVELRRLLGDANVKVSNLEVFPLVRSGPRNDLDLGLSIGAALGATRATAHIHDVSSEQEAIDRMAAFTSQAADHGIHVGLEFNYFSAVKDLLSAERIVRGAGCGSIVLDMLHAARSSAAQEDVTRIADLVFYAQLCDGPSLMPDNERWREAVGERLAPGDGAFPLIQLAKPLHDDVIFDVEVPQESARKAGVPPIQRARRAVEASRRFLAELEKERSQ